MPRIHSRLAKIKSHDGSGVYTVYDVEADGTTIVGSEFEAKEMDLRETLVADTYVNCIPILGEWRFL